MSELYANGGKLYSSNYFEIYVPKDYFDEKYKTAINRGESIETLGVLYCREFIDGKPEPIRLLDIPVTVNLMVYESKEETIVVQGRAIDVLTLQYLKDSYVLHQTLPKSRDVGYKFLTTMLSGKLPTTLKYDKIIDIWWRNLEISGINYKVPSKIYEMIISTIYRDPNDMKKRYGQYYGKSSSGTGYDYKTGNVRQIVKNLSTFSGMMYEDINNMITQGIVNSEEGVEEPESPLEKVIKM